MKRKFFILILCVVALPATAQENFSLRDRLFFGGNFGLMAGTYTDIEISPHVGYFITSRWAAGVGITYEYYNNKYHWEFYDPLSGFFYERYETHIWGGRLFSTYVLVNNVNEWIPLGLNFRIFAHVEDEIMSYEKSFFEYKKPGRKLQNSVLVGGGLRFPSGRRSSMNLTILWNLNSNMYDIYGGRMILRIGYNF